LKTQRSTRYGLYAAIELAATPAGELVTASAVAARYDLPAAVVAKVFQRLSRAGIAAGLRGISGGYRLSRPASKVTVLEVIEVFESLRPERASTRAAGAPDAEQRLAELFAELDEQSRATLASVTLETLVSPRRALSAAR
jgi:Rrf2 family protein